VKVLLVDDSRAMRMIVGRDLRELEQVDDLCEAESAEAAIEVLGSTPIDLVVCDWNMGGMTGLELLEALRAAGWTTPFGFVTSESSQEMVSAALAAGAAFLLAKPFRSEDLREKVGAVLAGTTPAARRAEALDEDRHVGLRRLLEALLRRPVDVATTAGGPPHQ
jgi:two-component system chemotaxis response regulator CheY